MEERLRFVARLLDGEGMSDVCREFGISRKTGYKIFNRYKDDGLEALTDRTRRPVRYPLTPTPRGRTPAPTLATCGMLMRSMCLSSCQPFETGSPLPATSPCLRTRQGQAGAWLATQRMLFLMAWRWPAPVLRGTGMRVDAVRGGKLDG